MSQEVLFPSREWAEEWCRLLNESKEYFEAAKTAPWDSVVLISTNVPENVRKALIEWEKQRGREVADPNSTVGAIKLNIKGGKCLGAEFHTTGNVSGAIVLEAPYET
ncbi:MAG: hypothetical protein QXO96_04240, partial [Sulfolobales archaeon]